MSVLRQVWTEEEMAKRNQMNKQLSKLVCRGC